MLILQSPLGTLLLSRSQNQWTVWGGYGFLRDTRVRFSLTLTIRYDIEGNHPTENDCVDALPT
jgi:hypothetical protein